MTKFKPTRRELRQVQRLANECEIDARVSQQVGPWYGMHRPAERAAEAMRLAQAVLARSQ
jgi:hypothetical protein